MFTSSNTFSNCYDTNLIFPPGDLYITKLSNTILNRVDSVISNAIFDLKLVNLDIIT